MSLFFNTVPDKIDALDPSWHNPEDEETVLAFLEWLRMQRPEFYCDCICSHARWAASASVLGGYIERNKT
jgi:hypothetical protein